MIFAALRSTCSGGCGRRLGCGWGCVVCLAGVGAVLVRGPPLNGVCCVGAWPLPWWGVLCLCAPPAHCRACSVAVWPLQWWGVLCWRVTPNVRPSCIVVWPHSLLGVLCRCVAPLTVGRALLLPVPRGGCAQCGGAWLGLSSCLSPGGRLRWVRVGGACGGVLAGAMRGLFCLFGVVLTALRLACSGGYGWPLGCGCGCVDRLAGVGFVLVRGPPRGGACCVGACPPPWWHVLCWCVAPPLGGVLRWFVAPLMVGRTVLVRGPPHGGACSVGARLPRCWCVVWWCLAWVVVVCSVAVAVVLFASPGLVRC